jgi:3-methyladenine DNA glycosylase/8-oxoguanine DNA glycosylase
MTLAARSPFSHSTVVRSHGWIRLAPFLEDEATGGFTYIDRLSSGRVIELSVNEVPEGVNITVEGRLSEAESSEVARKADWMLGLDQDFAPFYALTRAEPKLLHVEHRARGRVLRSPTLFEDTVKTILTTNTTWTGTIRMVENLVTQFGSPLPRDSGPHAFPTPGQLATANVQTLREETRLGYRAPYILELAQSITSGAFDLEPLKTSDLPTSELRKQILAIKGVGAYAAANLLMILGRYDFVPVDSWALKMVSHEWYGGEPVGPAEVEAAFENWGEWKGLAYWFWDWSFQGNE